MRIRSDFRRRRRAAGIMLERTAVMGETTCVVNDLVEEAFGQEAETGEEPQGGDAAELGAHQRANHRRKVGLPVIFKIILEDGKIFDRGKAVLRNISSSGALMEDLELDRDAIPASPFKISFKVIEGIYEGIEALCEPIRYIFRPRTGLGLRFEMLSVQV